MIQDWRERFDEKFPAEIYEFGDIKHYCFKTDPNQAVSTRSEIISFLESLAEESRKEGRNEAVDYILNHARRFKELWNGTKQPWVINEEDLKAARSEATEKTYARDYSHSHCWDQKQPSACGIPLEKHTQCCLCDTPLPK